MNIAMDGRGINWYKGTGIGTYTENVLRNLLDKDKDNLYHIYWWGENYEEFYKHNTNIILASKKHHRFFEESYFPYNVEKEKIDIFHIPQNGIGINNHLKCKKVVTIHDLIPYIMPETVGKGYLLRFIKDMPYIIENSDAIITVSEWSKRDILRFFPIDESKIHVTPLAADSKYKPLDKNMCLNKIKESFPIDSKFILYLGGFSSRKNVKGLIDAYNSIYKKFSEDIKLVLLGSLRDEGNLLREYVKDLNLVEKVIFTGFVEEEWLPLFYNGCECFVYPSLYEGFGLPPLEAMSCGTPVITSNISSIPEVVEESGILIDPYSIQELSNSMLNIVESEDTRALYRSKALKKAANFSWNNTAQKTLDVYMTLI